MTYVINIANLGNVAYTEISITDNLGTHILGIGNVVPLDYVKGSAKYYINGVLQTDVTVTAGSPLVIS